MKLLTEREQIKATIADEIEQRRRSRAQHNKSKVASLRELDPETTTWDDLQDILGFRPCKGGYCIECRGMFAAVVAIEGCSWYCCTVVGVCLNCLKKAVQLAEGSMNAAASDEFKKVIPRKTAIEFLNVYEEEDGTLYGGGNTHASLDIAARNAGKSRVGVVEVTLVNNIETGEVKK